MALSELRKSQIVALVFIFIGIALSVGLTMSNADALKILAVFAVLVVIPLFVLKPEFGFLALIVARPIIDALGQQVNFTIQDIITLNLNAIVGIFVVAWGIFYLTYKRTRIFSHPVFYPLLALSLLSLLSIVSSDYKLDVFGEWIRVTSFLVILLLAYQFSKNLFHFRSLTHAILLSSLAPAALGVYQILIGGGISDEASSNRIFATFAHPSLFGQYLAALMLLVLVLILVFSRYATLYGGAYLLFGFLLLFTFSRGAWIFAALGSLLLGVVLYRQHLHKVFFVGLFGLLVVAGAGLYLQSYTSFRPIDTSIIERISQTTQLNPDNSIVWRVQFWRESLTALNPFILKGYGAGTFLNFAERELNTSFEAHNDFLKLTVELGVLGFVSLVSFFVVLFVASIRNYFKQSSRNEKILAMLLVAETLGMLLVSSVDNLYQNTTFYWVVLALIGGTFRLFHESKKARKA